MNTEAFAYKDDDYQRIHQSLHEEDSEWKFSKIVPLVDEFMRRHTKTTLTVLDVGGGAGRIIALVCNHITEKYDVRTNKIILDLSPGALQIQADRNPDVLRVFNEDVRRTSLAEKEADLALMIDVLEHIPEPTRALMELRRISRYVIFKVPMEVNLWYSSVNTLFRNRIRRHNEAELGHVNVYSFNSLIKQVENSCGTVVRRDLAGNFEHGRASGHSRTLNPFQRIPYILGPRVHRISPSLNSWLFLDSALLLVDCEPGAHTHGD